MRDRPVGPFHGHAFGEGDQPLDEVGCLDEIPVVRGSTSALQRSADRAWLELTVIVAIIVISFVMGVMAFSKLF